MPLANLLPFVDLEEAFAVKERVFRYHAHSTEYSIYEEMNFVIFCVKAG